MPSARNQLLAETTGTSVTMVNQYQDSNGQLLGHSATNGAGTLIQNDRFAYQLNHNLRSRADRHTGANLEEDFGYDKLNQLTSASVGSATQTTAYFQDGSGDIAEPARSGELPVRGSRGRPHAVTSIALENAVLDTLTSKYVGWHRPFRSLQVHSGKTPVQVVIAAAPIL